MRSSSERRNDGNLCCFNLRASRAEQLSSVSKIPLKGSPIPLRHHFDNDCLSSLSILSAIFSQYGSKVHSALIVMYILREDAI